MSEPVADGQHADRLHGALQDSAEAGAQSQSPAGQGASQYDEQQAAKLIQKNYRGYRARRQLEGMGLDASVRWSEVCSASTLLPLVRY